MKKAELLAYIEQAYGTTPEYLWAHSPASGAFRHSHNRKWFAAILTVPAKKLGLDGEGPVDILNVKCDPLLVGSLRLQPGILPAWHMNKEHWVTLLLDGPLPDGELIALLAENHRLTK